ncbi:hypothetical protein F383_33471 [Gossypium arboreum]|uniref:Uncharacterized protein n=1 Tax=Gossypium arboreum TaxID=29729 RepID=A0A0B0N795_GOSAR|nr:hypothetical protein F383_33471 [Gossypium arboreum]
MPVTRARVQLLQAVLEPAKLTRPSGLPVSIEFTNSNEKSSIKCIKHGVKICIIDSLSKPNLSLFGPFLALFAILSSPEYKT